MVRRLLCLLLVELQALKRGISAAKTAEILHRLDATNYKYDQVEETVKEMLDAGSRYKNLEKSLGLGIVFVLGKDLAESW